MHAFFAAFVSLLSILPLVLSTPIPAWSSTVVNQPAVNDEASRTRVTAYNEADARAKEMVSKMVTVANSDKPEHKKIVNDAFGPNADRDKIKATVHKLNTQPVQVGTTDVAGVKSDLVATTPVKRPNGPTGPIKLGPNFFAADSSKDYRAGTLIHEATHQQSHTGDLINNNDKIVGALEDQKANIKMQDTGRPHIGYHFPGAENPKKVPTSATDLSDKYKNNRDHTVKNMHDNADSYRVFAHLCSQPGVARRDIDLFSRALLEADVDDHFYLAKRSSCALPKDYFKNKAAAKAAPANKGTQSNKPTSPLTKGAATKGARAQAVSKTGRKPSTPKSPSAGKGTKSNKPTSPLTKGAAAKGTRMQTASKAGRKPSTPKSPTAGKGTKSNKPTSRLTKGAATKGARAQGVSKAGRKPSSPKSPTVGKGTKSNKPTSRPTKGAATKGARAQGVSKAGRKPSSPKSTTAGKGAKSNKPTSRQTKGAATKGARAQGVSKAGRKPSSPKSSTTGKGAKSNKPTSRPTKGAATKGARTQGVSKAGRKPSAPKAPKGAAKQASRAASPGRTSPKGASGAKSRASTKSTKPTSQVAKGASKGTSRAQAKVNHAPQKKVVAAPPKKSTPQGAQKKVAAAPPKKSTPQVAQKKVAAAPPKKPTPAAPPKKSAPQAAPPKKAGKK